MKNLSRMHIHPNWMGAVRDSEEKQLFFNVKPRRLEFGGSKRPFLYFFKNLNLIYTLFIALTFCNLSFYYKLARRTRRTRRCPWNSKN